MLGKRFQERVRTDSIKSYKIRFRYRQETKVEMGRPTQEKKEHPVHIRDGRVTSNSWCGHMDQKSEGQRCVEDVGGGVCLLATDNIK